MDGCVEGAAPGKGADMRELPRRIVEGTHTAAVHFDRVSALAHVSVSHRLNIPLIVRQSTIPRKHHLRS
jgi:hypothetical protein